MRRAPSAVLLSVLVPMGLVVPVASAPHPAPRPVAPEVRSQPLRAAPAAATPALRSSARATFAAAGRPEVLVTRTGLAPFALLGVTWRAGARPGLAVVVRTYGAKGWTAWTALDFADSAGPAPGRGARPGSDPLWVERATGYQVRVDVRSGRLPAGLRVDLVDPGRSPADRDPAGGRPLASAAAATAQPQVLSRAQWGADESLRREAPRYTGPPKAGFVHHTAGANGYSAADVPKIIRAIYAYHVKGNGWSDIGYNYLVDRFGRLWEGRYGGLSANVLGAHTGGFNSDTFAVSAIGNYDTAAAPAVMVDAIARLMAWRLSTAFRDPNGTTTLTSQGGGTSRYAAGARASFPVVSGHRDAGSTSCPGANLYAALPTIRALTTSYLGTALLDPAATPAAATYGRTGQITTTARVTSDQAWTLQVRDVCRGTLVRSLAGTASPTIPVSAGWDLRDERGVAVRPGAYSVTLASADATAAARTWTGQVTVNATPSAPPPPAPAALPGRTSFVPLDPVPLYDSRDGANLPLGPGGRVDLVVPGAGKVPVQGVVAVALSVSASCATSDTGVSAWAGGAVRPTTPALNVEAGTAASALVVTPLGGGGVVSLANSAGTTELAVHVVGYYLATGGQVFRPVRAVRIYDSRRDPAGPLAPGVPRRVALPARAGVPAGSMTGALLNVTAVAPSGTGTLTVQSPGSQRDNATVAYTAGSLVKTGAVARLQDGALTLTTRTAASHVVVDLVGWWAPPEVVAGRLFQPRAATRVLDTRTGLGAARAKVGHGGVVTVKVAGRHEPVPARARAVLLNLTAREATTRTFVTAWAAGRRRPAIPDLAVPAWRTTANLVVVRVGLRGRVKLTNGSGATHLVADVVGYYP